MTRGVFSLIIDLFCWLLYPIVFLYNRFICTRLNAMKGYYWKCKINNKGIDLRIHGNGMFTHCDKIQIGDYCRIGTNAYFHASGGLIIGNNVQISRNVTIYTANHNFNSKECLPYDNTEICNSVIIGNNVWIGMNVSILPGVVIGDNAIIGMNAVITKDVPAASIVVGDNRVVRQRDIDPLNLYKQFGKEYPDA